MNRKAFGVPVLLLITLFLIDKGNSLECYTCSAQLGMQSYNQQDCQYFWNSYNYDQHKRTQCHHSNAVCAKYIVNHEGMVWVHRSCQPRDICSFLHARYSNPRSQLLECFTCEGNLCNGVLAIEPTQAIAWFSVAVALIVAQSWI